MNIEIINHYLEEDVKMSDERITDFIINGEYLYKHEDDYHHNVTHKIEGIIDYLNYTKTPYLLFTKHINDEQW
jgi:hypothetical protein